jgi:hypothetical protein
MTTVVNRRKEQEDRYVGRGTIFGNQWTHLQGKSLALFIVGTREEAIAKYKEWFYNKIESDAEFKAEVLKLKDKKLGCYCKQENCEVACHADIIAEYLNSI